MRKVITFFSILLTSLAGLCQQPVIEWQNSFRQNGYAKPSAIRQTPDNGFIVAGYGWFYQNFTPPPGYHYGELGDFYLVKLNGGGITQWEKCFGGSGIETLSDIDVTSDGGFLIAGTTTSANGDVTDYHSGHEYWIVKTDAAGTLQWQKTLGSSTEQRISARQAADGSYIVAGSAEIAGNHGSDDFWVTKLSSSGTVIWQKSYGGSLADQARSVEPTSDGGYIVAGLTFSNDGDVTNYIGGSEFGLQGDFWVVKLDADGLIQWQKTYGGSGADTAERVVQTSDGGYAVAGKTNSNDVDVSGNHGYEDYWLIKTDSGGLLQWQSTFGGFDNDILYDLHQTADGGFILDGEVNGGQGQVTGFHILGISHNPDSWVVKTDSTGNLQWQKALGSEYRDWPGGICEASDGGYVTAAYAASNGGDVSGTSGNCMWIAKLSATLDNMKFGAGGFSISPNPVASTLFISNPQHISPETLILTDLAGKRLVAQTGNTESLNLEDLAAGMYLLKITAGDKTTTVKVLKR